MVFTIRNDGIRTSERRNNSVYRQQYAKHTADRKKQMADACITNASEVMTCQLGLE
jgi:hypothetical protein